MQILLFIQIVISILVNRSCYVKSFQPVCFSPSGFNPLQFLQDHSLILFRSSSHLSQVVFVFPALPPFSSVIQFSSKSFIFIVLPLSVLFSLTRWFIVKILRRFVSYLFILVIFSGEFNSVIRVHHILFILVNSFTCKNSYQPIILFIHLFSIRCVEDISEFLVSDLSLFRGSQPHLVFICTRAISLF